MQIKIGVPCRMKCYDITGKLHVSKPFPFSESQAYDVLHELNSVCKVTEGYIHQKPFTFHYFSLKAKESVKACSPGYSLINIVDEMKALGFEWNCTTKTFNKVLPSI